MLIKYQINHATLFCFCFILVTHILFFISITRASLLLVLLVINCQRRVRKTEGAGIRCSVVRVSRETGEKDNYPSHQCQIPGCWRRILQ